MKREIPAARLRRIHHSPLFWLGAILFLAAITIYVASDDLSLRLRPDRPAGSP